MAGNHEHYDEILCVRRGFHVRGGHRGIANSRRRLLRSRQSHWGEQISLGPGNTLAILMLFQGLGQEVSEAVWRPFFDVIAASPEDFQLADGPQILALPAQWRATRGDDADHELATF
jgi:hypothetical protein